MKNKVYFLYLFLFTLLIGNKVSATTHTVQVGNYYFNPNTLNVEVGDTVKWVWVQGSHTTTSTTIPSGAATWDHPINSGSTSYSYKVTVAGTYNYKCTPHAAMGHLGSFTATAPPPALSVSPSNRDVTSGSGATSFDVMSNSVWMAVSDAGWCVVTPSGTGNGMITATYGENITWEVRKANISVTVDGILTEVVSVTQDASTVGIEMKDMDGVSVYPNPADNFVKLSFPASTNADLVVLDLNGSVLYSQILSGNFQYQIPVNTLRPGMYFFRISNSEGVSVRRIIVNR